jgi:hypothetical protein
MRMLFIAHRHVALDLADEYLLAWAALRNVATAADARAWVFQGVTHEDRFIEFIEWSDPAVPLEDAALRTALAQLDAFGPATDAAEWEEAT